MKCCKSAPKVMSLIDRSDAVRGTADRRLTAQSAANVDEDKDVGDVTRTYGSLPNIAPLPDSANGSRHSLVRANPINTLDDCSVVKVIRASLIRSR